jgi:hypothetical protein
MTAVWALVGAIFLLTVAIFAVAWVWWDSQAPRALSEDEVRQNGAPCVASELIVMALPSEDEPAR